ncbi:hypothetical protein BD413DRAFT_585522 [Trametes elegans]|nr:hypothetical protein BD413DRAFT_585522 [Trametes elegans]
MHVTLRRAAIVAAVNRVVARFSSQTSITTTTTTHRRMHTTMSMPAPSLRRKSQVYVLIPPFPLVSKSGGTADPGRSVHQENTPLKTVAMNADYTEASSPPHTSNKRKRKSMDAPRASHEGGDSEHAPKAKKPKTTVHPKHPKLANVAGKDDKAANSDKEAKEDVTYRCHQCTRQFDSSGIIQCTAMRLSGRQCILKYCRACMRNRYQVDVDTIKEAGVASSSSGSADLQPDQNYTFKCPRCKDECNCRICRKAKGLPATGDLHLVARKPARASNAQADVQESSTQTLIKPVVARAPAKKNNLVPAKAKVEITPKKALATPLSPHASRPKPHVLVPPSPHTLKNKSAPAGKPKARMGRPRREPAPRVMPRPVWTRMSTPLTYNDALCRVDIREFILRFGHLADIARGHLEEFEELGSSVLGPSDEDSQDIDGPELVGWVSEPAFKATLVGLLTVLQRDSDQQRSSAIGKAVHRIKASGGSLSKMSAALATFKEDGTLPLPDPLPPPPSTMRYGTRHTLDVSPGVTCTAQLVPVVGALIELAIQTKAVRDDFDRAVAQEKDLTRTARELTAEENARWKALDTKDSTPTDRRAARLAHKAALSTIEHARRVASAECIPRFAPLGRDTEGRVYFALTPGVTEREAAIDLLEGGKGEVKLGRRRGIAEESSRRRMRHWSWHLAVWGRKPEGAELAKRMRHDDDADGAQNEEEVENADDGAEGWWGFWQPEEVAKLSEWLAMKHGIDLHAKGSAKDLESNGDRADSVDSPEPRARQQNDKRASGRPSNASSVAESSTSAASRRGVRMFASLNRDSSDEEDEIIPGGNSSEDEDGTAQMRVDACGEPVPLRRDLRTLVRSLKEFADILEWRVKRASKETKEGAEKAEKVDKGKSVRKDGAISTQTFYGK